MEPKGVKTETSKLAVLKPDPDWCAKHSSQFLMGLREIIETSKLSAKKKP